MAYLLDTNVISELTRRVPVASILSFFDRTAQADLYLSVITVGEIGRGVVRQEATNPGRSALLASWLASTEARFGDQILPVSSAIARQWGTITAGRSRPLPDVLIAATALVHNLTLVTRNVRDFEGLGLSLLNPWD